MYAEDDGAGVTGDNPCARELTNRSPRGHDSHGLSEASFPSTVDGSPSALTFMVLPAAVLSYTVFSIQPESLFLFHACDPFCRFFPAHFLVPALAQLLIYWICRFHFCCLPYGWPCIVQSLVGTPAQGVFYAPCYTTSVLGLTTSPALLVGVCAASAHPRSSCLYECNVICYAPGPVGFVYL